jgi:hypothetical protein
MLTIITWGEDTLSCPAKITDFDAVYDRPELTTHPVKYMQLAKHIINRAKAKSIAVLTLDSTFFNCLRVAIKESKYDFAYLIFIEDGNATCHQPIDSDGRLSEWTTGSPFNIYHDTMRKLL